MNKERFEQIERRWLAASAGPWTVLDYRQRNDDPNQVRIDSFDDAVRLGACKTKDDYIQLLKEASEPCFEAMSGAYLMVAAQTPGLHEALGAAEDRRIFDGDDRPPIDCPSFSFAVSPEAKTTDLEFMLQAPADVGFLIDELRTAWAVIAELRKGRPG